jgi:class 3 adenylate cyclase
MNPQQDHPMESPIAYIPMDRRQALAQRRTLPERSSGAALFADISGFTPLTELLVRLLGPQRGAEELPRRLNEVYDALIAEIDRYGGTVLGFAGDAITCWFDEDAPHSPPPSPARGRGGAAQAAGVRALPSASSSTAPTCSAATRPSSTP